MNFSWMLVHYFPQYLNLGITHMKWDYFVAYKKKKNHGNGFSADVHSAHQKYEGKKESHHQSSNIEYSFGFGFVTYLEKFHLIFRYEQIFWKLF